MVKLSVFLVRHGEGLSELPSDPDDPPKKALAPLSQLYQPPLCVLEELSRRVDPELTDTGYQQAEASFRALGDTLREFGETRKLAFYSAPFKRCAASALMISAAGFEPEEWSVWALTTPETQTAPTAIPIIVMNGLCDCTKEIRQLGGQEPVVDAGLLLCAACKWNKAYKKDPIMGEIQKMKDATRERIKEWQDSVPPVEEGEEAENRFVADVQYLRFEENENPYSLEHMSMKFNIVTELLRPKKIMQPPRKGLWETKQHEASPSIAQQTLDECIHTARKAGCDTVIIVVSPELIQEVCERSDVGEASNELAPGCIVILLAEPDEEGEGVAWSFHSLTDYDDFGSSAIPPFSGPIEPTVPMPPDFAKAMEEAGEERWNLFPPPPPENIPPNYPKDIPSFSECLALPEPHAKWAWTSKPPKKQTAH